MNNVRSIENLTEQEFKHGIFGGITGGSWHEKYKNSAWVFVGGFTFELTEGDVICVMSQWGEIEDIHLVRDKETNKSKGFAFIKYEDYRSTILAVDNFNGITLLGRTLRCDHVENYKLPKDILEKEAEKLEEDPTADVDIGPGHAYKHKDLASSFNINQGVDLWHHSSGNDARPIAKSEDRKDDSDVVHHHKKESKKQKKHKHKHKKEKKERNSEEDYNGRNADDYDSDSTPSHHRSSRMRDSREANYTKKEDYQRDRGNRSRSRDRTHQNNSRDDRRSRSRSRESLREKGGRENNNREIMRNEKNRDVQPMDAVASWRGRRDPELVKQKLAKLENAKKGLGLGNDQNPGIYSSSNNKVYEEKKKDEFSSFGGFNRVR